MKLKDIRKKNESELKEILAVKREKLRELRFKDSNKQLKNVREIRNVRKEIAQLLTLLKEI